MAEFESVTSPPHMSLGWTSCWQCHVEQAWVPAVPLEHSWFPLRFAHAQAPCTACHTVGYAPGDTSPLCFACHEANYTAATMPPHAGMPTDCAGCHTDAGWRPSTFVHSWRLDNAHAIAPCSSCHTGNPPVYLGTPTECVGCHLADYNASTFPGHSAFPTTCIDCHSTRAWVPALAGAHPESNFPLSNGAHKPFGCVDCHDPDLGSSVDGANTNCVGCHTGAHRRSKVDGDHTGVRDYPFSTTRVNFCLDCHPRGINN